MTLAGFEIGLVIAMALLVAVVIVLEACHDRCVRWRREAESWGHRADWHWSDEEIAYFALTDESLWELETVRPYDWETDL